MNPGRWFFVVKEKKLNYRFHNPNTMEATISHLLEIFIEANAIKAKQAIEKAAVLEEQKKQ